MQFQSKNVSLNCEADKKFDQFCILNYCMQILTKVKLHIRCEKRQYRLRFNIKLFAYKSTSLLGVQGHLIFNLVILMCVFEKS